MRTSSVASILGPAGLMGGFARIVVAIPVDHARPVAGSMQSQLQERNAWQLPNLGWRQHEIDHIPRIDGSIQVHPVSRNAKAGLVEMARTTAVELATEGAGVSRHVRQIAVALSERK